jgi:hypothetical protein
LQIGRLTWINYLTLCCVQDVEQEQGSRGEDEEQKGTKVAPRFILRNFLRFFKYNLNANLSLNLFICEGSADDHCFENLGCCYLTNVTYYSYCVFTLASVPKLIYLSLIRIRNKATYWFRSGSSVCPQLRIVKSSRHLSKCGRECDCTRRSIVGEMYLRG